MNRKPEQQDIGVENRGATIRLEFVRHDRREPSTAEIPDAKSPLTKRGRTHTTEVGKTRDPNPSVGFAYGSPRARAQETAVRQLLANEEWITEDTTLEEMDAHIAEELKHGKKLVVTEKLNYKADANNEYAREYEEHYAKRKDLVPFLYYESDKLVEELNDLKDNSYTRLAANIAELIKRYIIMLSRWVNIYDKNKEKYKDSNEMQRFFGTHSTIGESFLLKIIEKTEGVEAAKKFIDDLPDKNGIDFSDGVSVVLEEGGQAGARIKVKFHDRTWDIEPAIIDAIIQDRSDLDERIKAKIEESK